MDARQRLWWWKAVPANHPMPPEWADLNPRELAVLRLLASGHTAKTIAAELGCTETAVHERLRDARRKTGVGSSRELARQLMAQKFWDEFPGLSSPPPPVNLSTQPGTTGRHRSKGKLIMLIAIPLAAAALFAVANPAIDRPSQPAPATLQQVTARPSPLVGRWALDVSRVPVAERPLQVVISFAQAQDGKWTTVVDITAPGGASQHAESTAAADGVPVPINGTMGAIDTAALKQPAQNTLVLTLGKAGVPVSTRVYAVAKGGKTMTETIVWAGDAMPKLETNQFSRIG